MVVVVAVGHFSFNDRRCGGVGGETIHPHTRRFMAVRDDDRK